MIRGSFNTDWFYCKEDGTQEKKLIGPITLPHDAMIFEKRAPEVKNSYHSGYFPGGPYRYSKTFVAPEEYCDKHVTFEFEGVYMNSEVYINGQLAGRRPSGYSNFYIVADPFLKYGQDNAIEVLVHNENEPNSRWYSGSGIFRNVRIMVGNHVHIVADGVRMTTQAIRDQEAVVDVATTVVNQGKDTKKVRIVTEFCGKNGVTSDQAIATINAGETATVQRSLCVKNPALWSADHPNLYACSTKIMDGETVLDENKETFGIRLLTLDSKNGLRINGEVVKLRGGCIHHDNGVIGACTMEAAEERRVRLMKQSGFNAIRSAHNPMSKAMLHACDRHGMLVMDEFSDTWFRNKTPYDYGLYFEEWWERDIEAMVDKDYNHPCVVLYSIGNEITESATPEGIAMSRKIANKVKSLDRTRFTTNSINGWYSYIMSFGKSGKKKKEAKGVKKSKKADRDVTEIATGGYINPIMNVMNRFMDFLVSLSGIDRVTKGSYATVDVAGYNYMAGRYAKDRILYPDRVIVGSETFPPEIAKNWRLVKKLPHVIGDFCWAGWDYLGEAGLCAWQYGSNRLFKPYPCIMADSPLFDITGHRGTQTHIHEITWGLRREPFIAVQPVNYYDRKPSRTVWRGTNSIASWTWDGYEGKGAVVEVYADADHVALFLNGTLLGERPAGDPYDFKAIFKTTYRPGELTAVAYGQDGKEIGRTTLTTADPQLCLHAQSEVSTLMADGADLAFINITLADKKGIVKPLAERKVTVQIEGAGTLMGFGCANPLTEEIFTDNEHTTYLGRALAVVRAGLKPGTVKVTVSAQGLQTRVLTIPVEAGGGARA